MLISHICLLSILLFGSYPRYFQTVQMFFKFQRF